MKKIIAGMVIVFGLSFVSLGNIGFAQCNPECESDKRCCASTNTCLEIKDYNNSCVKAVDKKLDEKQKCLDTCKKSTTDTQFCDCKCNGGIVLNTNIPFIGRCITKAGDTPEGNSAISGISSALTQIFMTLIITGGFAMIIRGGAQIAMGQTKDGKDKIINVIIAFAALGSLGIILRLINPNFFK